VSNKIKDKVKTSGSYVEQMERDINFVAKCSTNQLFGNTHSKSSVLCIQTKNTHHTPPCNCKVFTMNMHVPYI